MNEFQLKYGTALMGSGNYTFGTFIIPIADER